MFFDNYTQVLQLFLELGSKQFDNNNIKYILYIMKTTTSVKIDKNIKEEATALAQELGLSLSSVINATLKKFVIERRVVFSAAPEFNEKTKQEFLELRKDIKNNKNLSEAFINSKDLFDALEI